MSLDLWSTLATVGTFVVITATAIAAVIQLVHIRSANQINILTSFRESTESPDFLAALGLIRDMDLKLKDPKFRAQLDVRPLPDSLYGINRICRLFESLGCYVKRGMLDADLVCDLWGPTIDRTWDLLAETIVILRRARGPALFEDFEYLAFFNKQYRARHPSAYPAGAARIAPPDRYAKEDRRD